MKSKTFIIAVAILLLSSVCAWSQVKPGIPKSYLSTDGTFAANSDAKVPTEKAVKTYVTANASGSSTVTYTATATAKDVVYMTAAGTAARAKADSVNTVYAIGFATETKTAAACLIQTAGVITITGKTFTPGLPVYISPTTAGDCTQTPPATVGHQAQVIGIALTATDVEITLGPVVEVGTGVATPAEGGTGVANGTNNTLTYTGNYTLGLTLTGNTAVTLPTSGTLLYSGGALGTPASGTLSGCSGLPVSGITASTSTALGVGSIELGHASDTTLARNAAGVATLEGATVQVYSNQFDLNTATPTPAAGTNGQEIHYFLGSDGAGTNTGLAQAATFAVPSGTPVHGQKLRITILSDATPRALDFNAVYRFGDVAKPTTTVASKTQYVGFIYNSVATKWDCTGALGNL